MTLQWIFGGSFLLLSVVCIALQFCGRSSDSTNKSVIMDDKFKRFQYNYVAVFLFAMFADWLQGPYVYELYVSYGFSRGQIAELFVCGFASSMIVGTFIGGLADKLGRKNMCLLYCACYISACLTKTVNEYWTLMLGRFLSGISTSLLFSVFESWMICEHHKQGFDSNLLGETFSYATFGNGLVAVLAGLIANSAADAYGYVAPFLVALLPLTVVAVMVGMTWTENYGNQQVNYLSSLLQGFDLIRNDSRVAALGLSQSCFEGAMYTFVFMWTPALKSSQEIAAEEAGTPLEDTTAQYLGLIFAGYMVCVMIGSSLFRIFSIDKEIMYKIPLVMHTVAFLAMAITAVSVSKYHIVVYVMFLLFEGTVGVFYPVYGMIKSEKIPEEIRSAVMNIFRIPLNAFVVVLLIKIRYLSSPHVFGICALAHFIALGSYSYFYMTSKGHLISTYSAVSTDATVEMTSL